MYPLFGFPIQEFFIFLFYNHILACVFGFQHDVKIQGLIGPMGDYKIQL